MREACWQTGSATLPASSRADFAEIWVGPYQRLLPEWTVGAFGGDGRLLGYLTGCPDTKRFEARRKLGHALPTLIRFAVAELRLASSARPPDPERRRYLRRAFGRELSPPARFGAPFLSDLKDAFPAHLHMNVRPEAQGRHVGRKLYEEYVKNLRFATRTRGIHLFCGAGPRAFYERLGFREAGERPITPGVSVYAMAISI